MTAPLGSFRPSVRVHSIDQRTTSVLPSQSYRVSCSLAGSEEFTVEEFTVAARTITVVMIHFSQDVYRVAREGQVWGAEQTEGE
jgi:hypothetical protein